MTRKQTFVVTLEMPSKDDCGNPTKALTSGDIRSALWRQIPLDVNCIKVDDWVEGGK